MASPATPAVARFGGFPAGSSLTPVPNAFFTELLPQITSADELRVTLYVMFALARRKGYPRLVSQDELAADAALFAALGDGVSDAEPRARLQAALAAAVERGSLLHLDTDVEGREQALYFLNTPASQRALQQMRAGRLALGRPLPPPQAAPAARRDNVFQIYEANIGPITPIIAEELKEAEQLYPHEWLEEALREAALLNKRSWRYASRILQRWATEGRTREKTGRDPGESHSIRASVTRRFDDLAGR